MRILNGSFLLLCLVVLAGCHQTSPREAVARADPAPDSSTPAVESTSAFERKIVCFEASQAFRYDAVSPRDGVYEMTRNCYLPALETCVVEYAAPDGSATIFDLLTREPLVVYLNYPGLADEIEVSKRLSSLPEDEGESGSPEEETTPQRREYDGLAARIFGSCAR